MESKMSLSCFMTGEWDMSSVQRTEAKKSQE